MPVVEVMNYDKPVIASNLSIFQELIGDEINYFTISDDNKESRKTACKADVRLRTADRGQL